MRLFLAIEISTKVKNEISEALSDLRKDYPQLIWTEPNNYHLTIFFIGETDKVEKIKKAIEDLVFDQESFYLYSTNCGIFIKNKIITYLNFRREKKLEELNNKISDHFSSMQNSQLKFVPHLTFARGKVPSKQQYFVLKKKLENTDIDTEFLVDKVVLYESILNSKNTIYRRIAEFPLIKN